MIYKHLSIMSFSAKHKNISNKNPDDIQVSLIRMTSIQLLFSYLNDIREFRNVNHAVHQLLKNLKKNIDNDINTENNMFIYQTNNICEHFSEKVLEERNFKYLSKILFIAIENENFIKKFIKEKFTGGSDLIYTLLFVSIMELKYMKVPLLILISEYTNLGYIFGLDSKYIRYLHAILTHLNSIIFPSSHIKE